MSAETESETPDDISERSEQELKEIDIKARRPFPVTYFAKKSPVTLKLIEQATDTLTVKASNRWFSAYFESPQVVSVIRVYFKNLGNRPYFRFGFKRHLDGKVVSIKEENISYKTAEDGSTYVEARVFQLIEDVSFEPPKSFRLDRAITKVDIFGYSEDEFEDAMFQTLEVFSLKSKVQREIKKSVESANSTIEQAGKLKLEIEENVERNKSLLKKNKELTEAQASLNQQLSKLESDIKERGKALSGIEENISRGKERRVSLESSNKSLEERSIELDEELRGLQSQLDLFPAELSEFNKQGRGKITLYFWLSFIPVGLIVSVTLALFFGAADLTTKYQELRDIDLTTLVATRVPFAIVALFILHVAFQVMKILVREIFRINRQQLALSKLSIVAQEVVNSSSEGLTLSDEDLFDLKTRLKMTLLRSHLKTYLDDEFEFEVESSVFNSLLKKMKRVKTADSEIADVAKHAIDKGADIATEVLKPSK